MAGVVAGIKTILLAPVVAVQQVVRGIFTACRSV